MPTNLTDADTPADLAHRALILVTRFTHDHRTCPNRKGTDTLARLNHYIAEARRHGATETQIATATT